jgi:hypothetical protein
MNNEFSPIDLRVERKQLHDDITIVVLGINPPTFRERVEQVKSQWIPCSNQYHFWVLNYMSWPFGWSLLWAKPGPKASSGQVTGRLTAVPSCCTLRLRVVYHFFTKEINVSPHRNNIKRNYYVDNHWQYVSYVTLYLIQSLDVQGG